jgi:hypothetical protein
MISVVQEVQFNGKRLVNSEKPHPFLTPTFLIAWGVGEATLGLSGKYIFTIFPEIKIILFKAVGHVFRSIFRSIFCFAIFRNVSFPKTKTLVRVNFRIFLQHHASGGWAVGQGCKGIVSGQLRHIFFNQALSMF